MKPTSNPPLTLGAWHRHDEIARLVNLHGPTSVLELGMGRGSMGSRLAQGRDYVGVEPDPTSRSEAADILPTTAAVVSDISEVPDQRFDMVCAFEVIEHVSDDEATIETWASYLRPGGVIVISAPAFADRFGAHDRMVGHLRRYDPSAAELLLTKAGLIDSHVVVTGFPLGFVLEKLRNRVAETKLANNELDFEASAESTTEADEAARRTAASGRYFQPSRAMGPIMRGASAPFRSLQRLAPTRGVGLVASAVAPSL